MRLLTKEQAQELDRIAIEQMGIPDIDLMGKAGSVVAEQAHMMIADIFDPQVAIICGKGNNAGDGYQAALELRRIGVQSKLFIIPDKKDIKGASLFYYEKCVKQKIDIEHSLEPPNIQFDLIIDGLLGTGFTGEIRGPMRHYTEWINQQKTLVLAIDIPSGIDANNGTAVKDAVIADVTVTMGMAKVGMTIQPGKSNCGEIIPSDIGFPDIYKELDGMKYRLVDDGLTKKYLKSPKTKTHKHRQGKVLLVAGSRGMTGAAALAANAAMRSGTGLVTICAPESLNNIYETNIIEGLTVSCEDNGEGYFIEENYNEIEKYFDWSDTLLVGPGLGRNDSTVELVKRIVTNYDKQLVIDADALNCFVGKRELFVKIKSDYVITPHYGELARLTESDHSIISSNIVQFLAKFMPEFNGTLVAKNAPTIIAFKNEAIINTTGNQGLATGGTGDVLSGVIAGFIAQGIPTNSAAELGVYVHGKAADIMTEHKGFRGLIASDLLGSIPLVLKTYEQ